MSDRPQPSRRSLLAILTALLSRLFGRSPEATAATPAGRDGLNATQDLPAPVVSTYDSEGNFIRGSGEEGPPATYGYSRPG